MWDTRGCESCVRDVMTSSEERVKIRVKGRGEGEGGGVMRGGVSGVLGVGLPRDRILPQIKGPLQSKFGPLQGKFSPLNMKMWSFTMNFSPLNMKF